MKFKDLRLHRWPLGLTLGLSLAFFSCATTSQVKVTAEVIDPGQAANRSVMVVPDSFMSDTAEADIVAELVRGKLAALGFQINDTRKRPSLLLFRLSSARRRQQLREFHSGCDVRSIFPTGRDKPA